MAQFRIEIKAVVEMDEIFIHLAINWGQTGIRYVPVGSGTMEKDMGWDGWGGW